MILCGCNKKVTKVSLVGQFDPARFFFFLQNIVFEMFLYISESLVIYLKDKWNIKLV